MNRLRTAATGALVTFICALPGWLFGEEPRVDFTRTASQLQINVGGKPFATYVFLDDAILRPYFAHVHAPNGTQVTRNFPPIDGQDATDHNTMHPGIWLAFGDMNKQDFWRNKGVVRHLKLIGDPEAGPGRGEFTVLNRYEAKNKVVCDETSKVTV
jgi:hypothetical protein